MDFFYILSAFRIEFVFYFVYFEYIYVNALYFISFSCLLRSIMESVMMDTMYEIPSDDTIEECVVTKAAVDGESEPLTIHEDSLKKAK